MVIVGVGVGGGVEVEVDVGIGVGVQFHTLGIASLIVGTVGGLNIWNIKAKNNRFDQILAICIQRHHDLSSRLYRANSL